MKTFMEKPENVERKWYVIDAENVTLGRLSTVVADILTGKNKVTYTPHVDMGDHVIVLNSDKIILTGKKLEQKMLRHHTGYVGGLKEMDYKTVMATKSEVAVLTAVKGMLPKNKLGRKQYTRLHVYKNAEHNHEAQKPEKVEIKGVRI